MRRPAVSVAFGCLLGVALSTSAETEPSPPSPSIDDPLAGMSDPQTLSQLLQWSLKHQDLDDLHEKAEAVRRRGASGAATPAPAAGVLSASGNEGELPSGSAVTAELPSPSEGDGSSGAPHVTRQPAPTLERRAELSALAEQLMPNSVELMREALSRATDESLDVDEREGGLLDLEELAADLDNAKDLMTMGGFEPVLALLASELPAVQAAAAWVLGTAVKNHRELQLHLLSLRGLASLLVLVQASQTVEVRVKAMYALSATLRNCVEAQAAFAAGGGHEALLGVLSGDGGLSDTRLARKALALVTDLLREQRERASNAPREAPSDAADGGVPITRGAAETAEAALDGAANDEAVRAAAALGADWTNQTVQLCGAIVDCFQLTDDVDAQEKAIQALEQLVRSGLLRGAQLMPSGVGSGECSKELLRASLRRYRERCARESADADGEGGDGGSAAVGACEDLVPVAQSVEAELDAMHES